MPADFFQVVPHDPFVGNSSNNNNNVNPKRMAHSPGTQWSTLSHYLYHRRWIWSIQGSPGLTLSLNSVSRILSIITKMRLQEGFSFAHSASGILTFLLEVEMEVKIRNLKKYLNMYYDSITNQGRNCQLLPSSDEDSLEQPKNCACVVQYVLFPPHTTGPHGIKDW